MQFCSFSGAANFIWIFYHFLKHCFSVLTFVYNNYSGKEERDQLSFHDALERNNMFRFDICQVSVFSSNAINVALLYICQAMGRGR